MCQAEGEEAWWRKGREKKGRVFSENSLCAVFSKPFSSGNVVEQSLSRGENDDDERPRLWSSTKSKFKSGQVVLHLKERRSVAYRFSSPQ